MVEITIFMWSSLADIVPNEYKDIFDAEKMFLWILSEVFGNGKNVPFCE
jgi:hypothetical protein